MKLSDQLNRIGLMLEAEDPTTDKYEKLLTMYSSVAYIVREFGDNESAEASTATTPLATPQPAVSDKFPDETPFDNPATPEEDAPLSNAPEGELTFEYVRGLLTEVSQSGIAVQPLVMKYVPEGKDIKFSSIPKERYPDFVKELKSYAR